MDLIIEKNKINGNVENLLVDNISFLDIKPTFLKESADRNDGKIILVGIVQRADIPNQNNRIYPKKLLEREVEKLLPLVRDNQISGEIDHPECHRSSAEILTKNGWKLLKDVEIGEEVLTLNVKTNTSEWNKVEKVINENYNGKMISIRGRNIDAMVTPDHKFILKDRNNNFIEKTAQELFNLSKSVKVSHLSIPLISSNWNGKKYNTYEIPPVLIKKGTLLNRKKQSSKLVLDAKSWFSFLGFYLAKGCVENKNEKIRGGFRINIYQTEGETADKFREILKSLSSELDWKEIKTERKGFKSIIMFSVEDARLWTYLEKLGNKYTKYIPEDIKNASSELLSNLFEWFLLGDGSTVGRKYKRQSVFSVSKMLIEDLNEILIKIGGVGVVKKQKSKNDYIFANHLIEIKNKCTLYRLWIKKSVSVHLDFRFMNIEEVDYNSTIHCVAVKNGNFYCRDKGKPFWSGNSAVISFDRSCIKMLDLWWEGNDVWGKAQILKGHPAGDKVISLIENGVKIGISSRAIGSTKESKYYESYEKYKGAEVVEDDLNLITFDIVSNPSVQGAFLVTEQLMFEQFSKFTIKKEKQYIFLENFIEKYK